jgi:hypothetical protein
MRGFCLYGWTSAHAAIRAMRLFAVYDVDAFSLQAEAGRSGHPAKGVAAVEATVFAVTAPAFDEGHPVPRHPADEGVGDPGDTRPCEQKAVSAVAGVLDIPASNRDLVDGVAEQAAEVANPLVKLR